MDDVLTMSVAPAVADVEYWFEFIIQINYIRHSLLAGSAIGGSAGDVTYVSMKMNTGVYFPGSGSSTYQPLKIATTTTQLYKRYCSEP